MKRDLDRLRLRWAFVGGLAIAARAYPRFTNDLDVAVAVESDRDAEAVVRALHALGYEPVSQLERADGRLASVRLVISTGNAPIMVLDLLFGLAGIEPEIVAAADVIEVSRGIRAPVARPGHLVVMKLLSVADGREHDARDLGHLLRGIADAELERARDAIAVVEDRGLSRGRDLPRLLDEFRARASATE